MKFQDLLNEKFSKGVQINGNYIEVFESPTGTDIKNIIKSSKKSVVRLAITSKMKTYAWDGYLSTHRAVDEKIKGDFIFRYMYDPTEKDSLQMFTDSDKIYKLISDASYDDRRWKKKQYSIFKQIKKFFPREKVIFIIEDDDTESREYNL